MKVYKIKVNGKTYRVELEALEEGAPSEKKAEAPKAAEKPQASPASGEGSPVASPIQGSVVKVLVKLGDKVEKGQPIAIIEAMKLENEVVSSLSGEVVAVLVEKGNAVSSGDALIRVR